MKPSQFALTVPDLAETIDFFTRRLGFRVDMIVPADAPQTAVISGQGMTLRLETNGTKVALADSPHDLPRGDRGFLISRLNTPDTNSAWHVGRAGMQIPRSDPGPCSADVLSPRTFAFPTAARRRIMFITTSRIFQMIYCKAGWVRVVYEDQGPPFALEAGDCVLQPPMIRHRVLESSPGLEVIEVSCPAEHETWTDHELQLPTREVLPERLFGRPAFCAPSRTRSELGAMAT